MGVDLIKFKEDWERKYVGKKVRSYAKERPGEGKISQGDKKRIEKANAIRP